MAKSTKGSAAEALVQTLLTHGGNMGFCVPGESYLSVLDALYEVRDDFKLITCRQESGAAFMADAYGKLTGRPGLCFVTRGPGATNASAGVHVAFQDSTPMILFIGQVASDQVEREAFQEIDYRRMFGPLAKWVAQIDDPDRIPEYVGRAFHTALSGRPGPVVLALPEDMLSKPCASAASVVTPPSIPHPDPGAVEDALDALSKAQRPFLIAGGQNWSPESVTQFRNFAEANDLPVGVSFRAQDKFDPRSPSYAGDVGIGINPKLAQRVRDADVVLALGPRLGEMTTSGYTLFASPVPHQTLIHVHAGAEELGRVYQTEHALLASPDTFMRAVGNRSFEGHDKWREGTARAHADFVDWNTPVSCPGDVQVAQIHQHLREHTPDDTILCNGAGNYAAWLHRFYHYRHYRSQLAPTSGSMGYGVPASVAAQLVHPGKQVICCAGDGCFLMSSQELATAAQYDLPILFLVFNNSMFGTIRMHQERNYPARVSATDLQNPDFVALAKAYGLSGERAETTEQAVDAIDRAIAARKPALIEIMVDPEAISPTATLRGLRGG